MHKLRLDAYLVLIHALLYCHPDKHLEVLRVNEEVALNCVAPCSGVSMYVIETISTGGTC